jgi:iron complex outermembrane recepter protein
MKLSYECHLARAAAALLLSAWAPRGLAQSASNSDALAKPVAPEEIVQLPQFDVTSSRANVYRPTDTMSVNRVAGSIIDSPFSVAVVTPELITDLGANASFDVTRYLPGMSPGRGTGAGGIQDRQNFRGFESFSKTIDNFSSFLLPTGSGFQGTFDPAFVDRVELVMGPNSVLSPTGAPGGSVNIITKAPKFTPGTDLTAVVGNYNAEKLTVDSTGPIAASKKWSYRVIASLQDTKTYIPGSLKMKNASLQVQYAPSPNTKITAKYFSEIWGLYGTIAATNDNGIMISGANTVGGATLSDTPPAGFKYNGANGNADWGKRQDRFDIAQAELTSVLGGRVNMRLAAQVLYNKQDQNLAFPRDTPSVTIDPATGITTAVKAIDPTSVPVTGQRHRARDREIQFQNDYAANFSPGPVSLQTVVGWASQTGRSASVTLVNSTLPNANLLLDSYSPSQPALSTFTFNANIPATAALFQGYGVIRAAFLKDRLFVTAGASRILASVHQYSFKGVYFPDVGQIGASPATPGYLSEFTLASTGSAVAPTQPDSQDTYLAGVLFKPLPNVAVYGSYSTNAGLAANNPVWQAGKQFEWGLKSEFFGKRLQATASHFQITQSNVSTQNPLFNTGQSNIPFLLSDQTSHGIEFNVVGGLTHNASIIASYTNMKLRDPLGRRVRNIPDMMSNLVLNYRFNEGVLKNASAFVAISHQGNVAGETRSGVTAAGVPQQPGFYIAAWTVVNVGAGYEWQRIRFNLNIDNVLNAKFWWQPASRISVSPYPGLTARLTTTVHF